jgi:hypothetical protein
MRIAISMEPAITGSALFESLVRHPRLEPLLLAPDSDASVEAVRLGADALVSSEDLEVPGLLVITVSGSPTQITLRRAGTHRSVPYTGLADLADLLVRELSVERAEQSEARSDQAGASSRKENPT